MWIVIRMKVSVRKICSDCDIDIAIRIRSIFLKRGKYWVLE
jgi:hypothetical protein